MVVPILRRKSLAAAITTFSNVLVAKMLNSHNHKRPWYPPRTEELSAEEAEEVCPRLDQLQLLRIYHDAAAGIDGVMVLTVIDPKTNKIVCAQEFAIGDVDGMAREAAARSKHANVYLAPTVLRKDLPHGKRGTFEDIVAVLGGVIDNDRDTGTRVVLPPGVEQTLEVTTCFKPTINLGSVRDVQQKL
jgi:hypothetical protein